MRRDQNKFKRRDPSEFRKRVEAYRNGTPIDEIYDGGYIKEPVITPDPQYNEYVNSLPDNQRLSSEASYRSHRYWELNDKPKNFSEAIGRGMFEYNTGDNSWHARSTAFNKDTGEYELMKPNWHDTKMYEDAWYYSKEGEEFRSKYLRKPGAAYDKYIPKHKNGKLPGYRLGINPSHAKIKDDGTFTDDYTKLFNDIYVTPKKVDLKYGSHTLNSFPEYLANRAVWLLSFVPAAVANEKPLERIYPEFDLITGPNGYENYWKAITGTLLPISVSAPILTTNLNEYKDGKIAIKPSKRGTFTAAAKKHGASVREFESRVLRNPEKYSKAMVKKARFSHNARSWKH